MPTYLLATLQSQIIPAQLIKNFWEIITSSSSPVLSCFSSALHLLFQLSSLWRFFFFLPGWGLRFPCLWLVTPGAGCDVVFRWSHLCSSIRKEGKRMWEKWKKPHYFYLCLLLYMCDAASGTCWNVCRCSEISFPSGAADISQAAIRFRCFILLCLQGTDLLCI